MRDQACRPRSINQPFTLPALFLYFGRINQEKVLKLYSEISNPDQQVKKDAAHYCAVNELSTMGMPSGSFASLGSWATKAPRLHLAPLGLFKLRKLPDPGPRAPSAPKRMPFCEAAVQDALRGTHGPGGPYLQNLGSLSRVPIRESSFGNS